MSAIDIQTIKSIKKDFGDRVRVIFLSYKLTLDIIREVQKTRNISDDEINLSLQKIGSLYDNFMENRDFI